MIYNIKIFNDNKINDIDNYVSKNFKIRIFTKGLKINVKKTKNSINRYFDYCYHYFKKDDFNKYHCYESYNNRDW